MKTTRKQASLKKKHGIKLWVYPTKTKVAGVVFIEVSSGHFEEFYHKKSAFIYYVIQGKGTFFLNGKAVLVKTADLVVIPPKTKIYYMGKMKMTLTTTPAWTAKDEVHIRFIKKPTLKKTLALRKSGGS